MAKLTKLIDVSKCTACRGCQVACKNWNQNPATIEPFKGYLQTHKDTNAETFTIVKMDEYVDPAMGLRWLFRKHGCFHCENPACLEVCPRQAYSKNEWGATVHNPERCIGCQYCTYACPWHVPKYLKREDIVRKCTLCANRVDAGLEKGTFKDYPLENWPEGGTSGPEPAFGPARELATFVPACVKTCPAGALSFGERERQIQKALERVQVLRARGFVEANVYGLDQMGGLNVMYVLQYRPETYGLPAQPKPMGQVAFWQNIVKPYAGWLIPVALGTSVISFFTTRLLGAGKDLHGHGHEEGGEE
ncbi:MAG: 4Fe-4S dicluster domain-containing protein [Syntrophomonadaceae bacterium]|jgi:formate dehydrogenase iron-sulfur subunit|nr:4Fe-4S dicluster domain-containing protein [Syntrophomonadaceae bacterium]MDH7497722.1 4Fe-4S dicluster domain-containing protein [Syntrophomonadaceae bacterium]